MLYSHVLLASLSIEAGDSTSARAEITNALRLIGPRPGGDERLRQIVLFLRGELPGVRQSPSGLAAVVGEMEAGGIETPELLLTRGRLAFLQGDSVRGWRELEESVMFHASTLRKTG